MIARAMERARGGHWLPQQWQARRANLERGRASLAQQVERLTEAYLAGIVPLPEYERRRRDTEARLLALEHQEQELLVDADRQNQTAKLAEHGEDFCRRVRDGLAGADFARKRAVLELLVDRVIVTDGEVEIRYAFPTGPDGEREPFCRSRTDYRDGLITNDKFCLSRFGQLKLNWWRFPLRLRPEARAICPPAQKLSAAGVHDAGMAGAPCAAAPPGRAAPLGSGLSAAHGVDPTRGRCSPGRPRASRTGGEP
jgi:hypothetical protein